MVTIEEDVETIGNWAFYSCSSLKCIYFYGKTSLNVGTNAFYNVPAASVMKLASCQNETFGDLNVSKGTTIDECLPPTLTFTQSNIFTQLNIFTKSNTFTESNIFTKSNTFTASLLNGATLTNTFILTNSVSLTQRMFVWNSTLSNSFTISVTGTGSTYVQTKRIYYSYTAVAYTFYHSYCHSIFTIYYANEAATSCSNNNTTITAACAAAGAVVVITLLVVLLIKIQSRKKTRGEQEVDNFEQDYLEATNSFSGGLSISHVEEDPFANDFKEDKFFGQI